MRRYLPVFLLAAVAYFYIQHTSAQQPPPPPAPQSLSAPSVYLVGTNQDVQAEGIVLSNKIGSPQSQMPMPEKRRDFSGMTLPQIGGLRYPSNPGRGSLQFRTSEFFICDNGAFQVWSIIYGDWQYLAQVDKMSGKVVSYQMCSRP